MVKDDLVRFLEGFNFDTREPTENFIQLKEEYNTKVVPRRKALKELQTLILDKSQITVNEAFKQKIIDTERQFSIKILKAGEAQKYFFSEKLYLGQYSDKRVNLKSGIMCPFKYCAKISDFPNEIREAIEKTNGSFYNCDQSTFKKILSAKQLEDFGWRVAFWTYDYNEFCDVNYLMHMISLKNIFYTKCEYLKIGSVLIVYFKIGEFIYFAYAV